MTLADIRADALETLNNYGERFRVEVAKYSPDDPDDCMGEMTIVALRRDGEPLMTWTCFVRPEMRKDAISEDWEFDFTDRDHWLHSGELWEVLAHEMLDDMEREQDRRRKDERR